MNAAKTRTFHKRKSPSRDEPADKVQKQEVNIKFENIIQKRNTKINNKMGHEFKIL